MQVPKLRFREFEGEWVEKKLGDILTITSAARVHKNQWTDKGVPFFRSSDVVASFKGAPNTKAYIPLELYQTLSKKIGYVKKDDLLVTGGGSIGIPFLIKDNHPLYFKDADLLWLKNTGLMSGFFIYSFLSTSSFRKYLESISHIGTIAHYTVVQAKNTPCQFPSLPEQQKIAAFLGAVDEKIQQLTQKKALLEQYKKGVMQKLFSQELRFKQEDGKDFPDWEEKRLGELFSFHSTNSLSRDKLNYESGEVYNIHYGDIHTKFKTAFDLTEANIPFVNGDVDLSKVKSDSFCRVGDLVMADASEDYEDIGKTIELINLNNKKVLAGLHTFLVRPTTSKTAVGFFSYLLKSWDMRKQIMTIAQGTKVLSLSTGRVAQLKLKLPATEEQQKIATFLSGLDSKIEGVDNQITQTQTFKKGLLQQMFV